MDKQTKREAVKVLVQAGRTDLALHMVVARHLGDLIGETIKGKEGQAHFYNDSMEAEQYPPGGKTRGVQTAVVSLEYNRTRLDDDAANQLGAAATELERGTWKRFVGMVVALYNQHRDQFKIGIRKQKAVRAPNPEAFKHIPTKDFKNPNNVYVMPHRDSFALRDLNDRNNDPSAFTQGPRAHKLAAKLFDQWKDMKFRDILGFWGKNRIKYHYYMGMD